MLEALTIVASVTTIVSNVWKISKDVYELIDGIKNAPDHIKTVSQDVRGLYVVLGSLQQLLVKIEDDELPPTAMSVFELLNEPMTNRFTAFVELQKKINKLRSGRGLSMKVFGSAHGGLLLRKMQMPIECIWRLINRQSQLLWGLQICKCFVPAKIEANN
jgi:hypothetical protein